MELAAFVQLHLELLELERRAEVAETEEQQRNLPVAELERRGVMLRRLAVAEQLPDLSGRPVLRLEPSRTAALPAHRFGPGDLVLLRAAGDDRAAAATGVVLRAGEREVRIALDDSDGDDPPPLVDLLRATSDVTYRRLRDALRALPDLATTHPAARLRAVLLGDRPPAVRDPAPAVAFLDPTLDASQRAAVQHALASEDVALLHGPPGTGKTTALVEVVRQTIARGDRVLACAPSNVAVDNLVERLAAAGVRLVRIGHPARMLPAAAEFGLDALTAAAADRQVDRALRRDLDAARRRLARAGRDRAARRAARDELRALQREARAVAAAAVRGVLDAADVVLATTTGAADPVLADRAFDLVVVDEAAQAVEAACWVPLLRGRRAVLAGDHCQLPPTILSEAAARRGLARSLFERLADRAGDTVARMLLVQYRMHETIMSWASRALYGDRLVAADAVRGHRLCDLPGVAATPDTEVPLLFVDTAGCGHDETEDADERSKANPGEGAIAARHVERLLEAGVPPAAIGVITPYNAQVQLLRGLLAGPASRGVEIGTVDGFQGREKEAIVLSLVRSNDRGEVGFLAESRRLNVAVTRARRHAAVVGDSATLACDAFLAGLIDHCHAHGEVRSAWEA